jgi:hypothetical protein
MNEKGNTMPIELMRDYYQTTSERAYVNMTMALHCAPFLKGIRNSALLVLTPRDARLIGKMLYQMKAKCKTMYRNEEKIILLLYREEGLKDLLRQERTKRLLEGYGYMNLDQITENKYLNETLYHLKSRFESAYGKKKGFPHEIGVFLGYPIEDVIGFIENDGQNSLLTGYWKVYSNKERAEKIFQIFDEARESAIYEVLEGKKFYEIAV